MTPEKVIELARQTGIFIEPGLAPTMDTHKQLFDFAQLVRNETLEWAAVLCDDCCQEQIRSMNK